MPERPPSRPPIIGITAGRHVARRTGRVYTQLPLSYSLAIEAAGGLPLLIPTLADESTLAHIFEGLDGIMFPGGVDVDPARYGEAAHPTVDIDEALDGPELFLARLAVERELTTLGVCRGQQLLNVALGGTLYQDLPSAGLPHVQSQPGVRDELAHPIEVEAGSRLAAVFGSTRFEVNSFHHQGIRVLGRGLRPVAWAPDGVIEGVESVEHPWLLAAQFHPEDMVAISEPCRRLFAAFVAACAERSRLRLAVAS